MTNIIVLGSMLVTNSYVGGFNRNTNGLYLTNYTTIERHTKLGMKYGTNIVPMGVLKIVEWSDIPTTPVYFYSDKVN